MFENLSELRFGLSAGAERSHGQSNVSAQGRAYQIFTLLFCDSLKRKLLRIINSIGTCRKRKTLQYLPSYGILGISEILSYGVSKFLCPTPNNFFYFWLCRKKMFQTKVLWGGTLKWNTLYICTLTKSVENNWVPSLTDWTAIPLTVSDMVIAIRQNAKRPLFTVITKREKEYSKSHKEHLLAVSARLQFKW